MSDRAIKTWKRRRILGIVTFLAAMLGGGVAVRCLRDPWASILGFMSLIPMAFAYVYMRWCPGCSKIIPKPGTRSSCPYCGIRLE